MYVPTEVQKIRLTNLAHYLLSGDLKADFYMNYYTESSADGVGQTACGSIGCAVGHSPFVGPDHAKQFSETWNEYCLRLFGLGPQTLEWYWCFAGEWAHCDNTASGAAKRILYLLDNGVPERFHNNSKNEDDEWDYSEFMSLY